MNLKLKQRRFTIVSNEVERLEHEYNEALKRDAPFAILEKLRNRIKLFKKDTR
jgi:hypothetical protein